MPYTKCFLVPDYYKNFECKCGNCRSCCCGGWGIPVGMDEYFRLVGLDCSDELRRRLDTAFHLAENRSPEHYAMVTPRFDGHCRLQQENGLCMLQRERGEGVLPTVCRYYPRAPRLFPFPECCTSASCEETLELLFADSKPVGFVTLELTFDLPEPEPNGFPADYYISTRLEAFAILGDRTKDFASRVATLSARLYNKEDFCPESDENIGILPLALEFFADLSRTSETFQRLLPTVNKFYETNQTSGSLENAVENLDTKLEKLFVNHLFYKSFPNSFVSAKNHLPEEAMSISMAVALTKLVAAAYLSENPGEASFVDVIADLFRVIEHSRFDECAVKFLRQKRAISLDILEKLAKI